MIKKYVLTSLLLLVMLPFAKGQQGLTFVNSVHDFAAVAMQDTLLHRFEFRNNTEKIIRIKEVKTDCACAIIRYPESDIGAQATGFISISYLPYKVGEFHKKFEVHTSDGHKEELELLGEIVPFQDYKRLYRHLQGPLRTSSKLLHFGRINTQAAVTKKFVFFNPTDTLIAFTGEVESPSHIKVMFDTLHKIEPKSTANIYLTYDAVAKADYGNVEDSLIIFTNYSPMPRIHTIVSANIEPHFAPITEETLAEYPHLDIAERHINLGYLYHQKIESDTIEAVFELKNKGFARLEILKIILGQGCELFTDLESLRHIEPGERRELRIRYTNTTRGKQTSNLILICNDPRAASQTIQISATVR
ncbi:MAG: DUF1573 domain-containing protein [Bernardetiaceae bacterium]|nr:DUF1573 domain-containing protein [Bernardetiaceae bacterium]